MAYLTCRVRARLRRWYNRSTQAVSNFVARSNTKTDDPPPYSPGPLPVYPRSPTASTENLDILRARHAPRPNIRDNLSVRPQPTSTLLEDCEAAARSVEIGVLTATFEEDREMVAARTLQAIATAASTSRSYPAFVAAATFAEMMSLIQAETPLRSFHLQVGDREDFQRRRRHAFNTAIKAAMDVIAATDGMTSNSNKPLTNT